MSVAKECCHSRETYGMSGWWLAALASLMLAVSPSVAFCQTVSGDPPTTDGGAADDGQAAETPAVVLAREQRAIAERFNRLEDLLLRSSELEASENPTRAALLQQAAQLGKQSQLGVLLARAGKNLENDQFSEAIQRQKLSRENLRKLLELLQTENRQNRVREKRDQVRRWIEETDRLLRLQGSLRGRTEGGQEFDAAAGDQSKLAAKAGDIASDLRGEQESGEGESSDQKSGEDSPSDTSQPSSKDPSDTKPPSDSADSENSSAENANSNDNPEKSGSDEKASDGKPSDGTGESSSQSDGSASDNSDDGDPQKTDSSSQSGKSGKQSSEGSPQDSGSADAPSDSSPSESQPGQSQPGQSQPGQSQPGQSQPGQSQPGQSQPQNPTERAQQRLEQAQQKMREAQQDLENAEREGAVQKQREAEAKLREAIEELEEILRQLREEEIGRSLASLESRLRRMLEMQNRVWDETQRLHEIAGDGQGDRQVEIRASNLALEERKILAEGERAYLLLREEGSSAAFPEAVEQLNADIGDVVERLNRADVGEFTLLIEQEIVTALEEMVAALIQVQKENKERQQQQPSGAPQQGQSGEQPLVDQLAELRLVRTLQLRINKRTDLLSKMLDDPDDSVGQVEDQEIRQSMHELSARQSSIQQVIRDIVVGENR